MDTGQPVVSVIVPALNEAPAIGALLADLAPLRAGGDEIVVVDGGSSDATIANASGCCDRLVRTRAGRAHQLNAGARVARGRWLWFVHADTRLLAPATVYRDAILAAPQWGFFPVRLSGRPALLRVVEVGMNLRSRWRAIATGDQGLFVARELFEAVGGYPPIELMEDIALSATLRRRARPIVPVPPLQTSSRRWETAGIVRTIALMWWLRLRYYCGADPAALARRYRGG